ncbi:fimbrial protein [Pseudomonas sp. SIMBA_077]
MRFWQLLSLSAVCSIGVNTNASANLTFSGTLVEPPACTINNGNTIAIDFKDVGVNKVDGTNYRLPVNYTITCAGSTLPWEMVLSVVGTATTFDGAAVQSSVTDLGIRILQNGQPFKLNAPMIINPATPPALEAVPVQLLGATLSSGVFNAAATLLAEYQ